MKLVIVESPSKAKTLEKYLGKEYMVDASGGHVVDLPAKSLGVSVADNFKPKYQINANKKDVVKRLKEKAKKADYVYLATDPDREGEAISWHLERCLGIGEDETCRIEFNEISKKAVQNALTQPRKININLVDAQQARRVLDRLVGYKMSPLLCKKIADNLSAGRVQSVALRLVVEREREILDFKPEESYLITLMLSGKEREDIIFKATLSALNGKKFKPKNKQEADVVLNYIEDKKCIVENIKRAIAKSKPSPPFTTSTMQQDGVQKLSMTAPQVMMLAQNLYEGVNVKGEGQVALVTYIRTDSVRVSKEAQDMALEYIAAKYGSDYVPKTPNEFKVKKSAQDAHEAIRPITLERTPESLKGKMDDKQLRLYKLIYERFVASQMAEAEYNTMTVDIAVGDYTFRASGRSEKFKGYTIAYETVKKEEGDDEVGSMLPNMSEGEVLKKHDVKSEQKFTKPPLRFTDASLVKAMEEKGIGRPSTYASIISTISKRQYTDKDGKYMKPTELGMNVNDMVVKYFDDIINTSFTAQMEEKLDEIEFGGKEWQSVVGEFYTPFLDSLNKAIQEGDEVSDEICDKCGSPMVIKKGKFGRFLACNNYPDCQNIKPLDEQTTDEVCPRCGSLLVYKVGKFGKFLACSSYPDCKFIKNEKDEISEEKCDKCGSPMIVKTGKFGKFLACSNYPECKNIRSLGVEKVMACPQCGKDVVKKRSKAGKIFYGCSGYPDCDFVSWDQPAGKNCPECGKHMVIKVSQKKGNSLKCSSCAYTEKLEENNKEIDAGNEQS